MKLDQIANRPIGIFDSGLGGLTVVKAIKERLPKESLIYFGDTARVPYGTKSPETVTRFSQQIVDFLKKLHVKLTVVACNTASSLALPSLIKNNGIPIIGVINSGARMAAMSTHNQSVGVIGTLATINSNAYLHTLKAINPAIKVKSIACPLFVPLVEEGWTEDSIAMLTAQKYLKPFSENSVDTIILGCTHYPILKKTIQASLPSNITLVDSAESVSREVENFLSEHNSLSQAGSHSLKCFVTDLPQRFEELGERFLGESIPDVSLVQLD